MGFVAQDTPTYARLSVEDHLHFGAQMNPGWDEAFARRRIDGLGLPLDQFQPTAEPRVGGDERRIFHHFACRGRAGEETMRV